MKTAQHRKRRLIVVRAFAAIILSFVVFGGRFGPATPNSNRRTVSSPNGRYSATSTRYSNQNHGWAFRAIDAQEQGRVVDFGCSMWYDVLNNSGDAFLTDDGEWLITLESYADAANSIRMIQFHDRSGLHGVPFRYICDYPRRLFPFEPRPANDPTGNGFIPTHKWIDSSSFDGRILHVVTTGLYSVDIDVRTQAIVARRFNYGTPMRWAAYALVCVGPAMILAHALLSGVCRGYRWTRARFFSFDPNKCRACGYLLIGLTESRCPECGTRFDGNVSTVTRP